MNDIVLSARAVSKTFGAVKSVRSVTLDLGRREALGLIGPNGAGKSTFINVLSGVYGPSQGSVIYQGADVTKRSVSWRARNGLVRTFQRPSPMPSLRCIDSVAIGGCVSGLSRKAATKQAWEVLGSLGLGDKGVQYPSSLTTGQLKLVDLARVIMLKPRVMLLDELMSGLSADEAETAIDAVAKSMAQGASVLFVEHILEVVEQLCTRLAVMDAGSVLTHGTFREVMSDRRVVAAYLGEEAYDGSA